MSFPALLSLIVSLAGSVAAILCTSVAIGSGQIVYAECVEKKVSGSILCDGNVHKAS